MSNLMDPGQLGLYLRSQRRRAGLKQSDIAARLGTHQSKVSGLEAGRSWDLESLAVIAGVFGVSPGTFLDQALEVSGRAPQVDHYEAQLLDALRAGGPRRAILYLVDHPLPRDD